MTEDQKKKRNIRQESWKKENRERFNVLFEPGTTKRIRAAISETDISVSKFIQQAVEEKLNKQ